jgi:hypothetical protein
MDSSSMMHLQLLMDSSSRMHLQLLMDSSTAGCTFSICRGIFVSLYQHCQMHAKTRCCNFCRYPSSIGLPYNHTRLS